MTITLNHNNITKKFTSVKALQTYLDNLQTTTARDALITGVQSNLDLQTWLVKNNYLLPLGYSSTSSYKGMTEHYDDIYLEFDGDEEFYEIFENIHQKEIANYFNTMNLEEHSRPTFESFYAKFLPNFSAFEDTSITEETY